MDLFENVSPALQWAIMIVAGLIVIVAVVSVCVSIWLAIKYVKFNRRINSSNLSGKDAARKILDDNGLQHIKVSVVGSMMFGNSYSHYFKTVRRHRQYGERHPAGGRRYEVLVSHVHGGHVGRPRSHGLRYGLSL